MELSVSTIKAIENILDRGNTAEVKKRKDDVIVLENIKKIKDTTIRKG